MAEAGRNGFAKLKAAVKGAQRDPKSGAIA